MKDDAKYYQNDMIINCDLCLKMMEVPLCDHVMCFPFYKLKKNIEEKKEEEYELFD